jgi:hypothetical protein
LLSAVAQALAALCCCTLCLCTARWRKQLDELKRRWAAEQVASDRAWAAKLEEQHNKWLKVRQRGSLLLKPEFLSIAAALWLVRAQTPRRLKG